MMLRFLCFCLLLCAVTPPSASATCSAPAPPPASGHTQASSATSRWAQKMALRLMAHRLRRMAKRVTFQPDTLPPCGRVILMRGDTVQAHIFSVDTTEVRYLPCGQRDYPVFVVNKSDVRQVIGASGKTVFKQSRKGLSRDSSPPSGLARMSAGFMAAAYMLVLLGNLNGWVILFSALSLLVAFIALQRIADGKGSGKTLASIVILFSALLLLISLLRGV